MKMNRLNSKGGLEAGIADPDSLAATSGIDPVDRTNPVVVGGLISKLCSAAALASSELQEYGHSVAAPEVLQR
jgi:hypothetical protein